MFQIVRPVTALVVVDVQNDFISGSLSISNCPAKQNGEEVWTPFHYCFPWFSQIGTCNETSFCLFLVQVVEPINRLLDSVEFDSVYYTLDWHPENHISFVDNVSTRRLHSSSHVSPELFHQTNSCTNQLGLTHLFLPDLVWCFH